MKTSEIIFGPTKLSLSPRACLPRFAARRAARQGRGERFLKRAKYYFAFLLYATQINAQDIHFSQFYESPLLLNPAAAGATKADYRFAANYKNQWKSVINPFKTAALAFDTKLLKKNDSSNYLGLGISLFNDKVGISKFTTNQANVDLAYHLNMNKENRISFGVKTGFFQKYINAGALRWDNQFNGVDYDASRPSGENMTVNNLNNVDLGAGIVYTYNQAEKGWMIQGGAAATHLTQPKNSFYSKDVSTKMKMTGHVHMQYQPKDAKYMILPSAIFVMQGPHMEAVAGTNVAFLTGEQNKFISAIHFGAFYRYKDAAIFVAALEYKKNMKFGVSYDVNVSRFLNASKFRGGPEFSFVYTGFRKIKKKEVIGVYSGIVFDDTGKPVSAEISITPMSSETSPFNEKPSKPERGDARNLMSDVETGKYKMELNPGINYKVKVTYPGYEPIEENIDLLTLSQFTETQKDFNLVKAKPKSAVYTGSVLSQGKPVEAKIIYTPLSADNEPLNEKQEVTVDPLTGTYRSEIKAGKKYKVQVSAPGYQTIDAEIDLLTVKDINNNLNFEMKPVEAKPEVKNENPCSEQLPDVTPIKGKSLRDPLVYEMMLDLFSNWCMEGVVFKVQVAAYPIANASQYKHKYLDDLGHISAANYPDGLTRFTLDSEFKTIREVEELRQKAIGNGQKDSWITVFVNGKRVTLEDFIGH